MFSCLSRVYVCVSTIINTHTHTPPPHTRAPPLSLGFPGGPATNFFSMMYPQLVLVGTGRQTANRRMCSVPMRTIPSASPSRGWPRVASAGAIVLGCLSAGVMTVAAIRERLALLPPPSRWQFSLHTAYFLASNHFPSHCRPSGHSLQLLGASPQRWARPS